ncbi:MAG TPA: glycosyltransferase family 4 protein [Patescibacteria group bacterium]|nr:glycosyltransferase family 4 protein [Patescibacteria group bacterium]
MKAAIHNQYLDTLGGGERYTLSFALALAKIGYTVDITWQDPSIQKLINSQISSSIKEKLEDRFGLKLDGVNFVEDIKRGDGYDLCFWVSDGSIPTLKARKNILHFQVPFHNVGGNSLLNKMKLFRIDHIVCNSQFTKKVIDREYGVESVVLYPPVSVDDFKSKRKENLIIYVGRFSKLKQSKRQDVLIKAFKNLTKSGINDWKLILAGGVEVGVGNYIDELKKMSKGANIEIIESPDFKTLKELYGISRIFWSAAGFDDDEDKYPERVEHFGMTVVEAMASGAVPVVYNAGGHKEIIKNNMNGFLWNSVSELVSITKRIINEKGVYTNLSKQSKIDSQNFSYQSFESKVLSLIK